MIFDSYLWQHMHSNTIDSSQSGDNNSTELLRRDQVAAYPRSVTDAIRQQQRRDDYPKLLREERKACRKIYNSNLALIKAFTDAVDGVTHVVTHAYTACRQRHPCTTPILRALLALNPRATLAPPLQASNKLTIVNTDKHNLCKAILVYPIVDCKWQGTRGEGQIEHVQMTLDGRTIAAPSCPPPVD
jgi:hypothetical protein